MAKKLKAVGPAKATGKVKLSDLMQGEFQLALAALMNGELPIKTSYELLKVFDEVVAHQKHFEDIRMKLLDKYGQKNPDGTLAMNEKKTQFLLASKEGFDKEYGELLSIEVEISRIPITYIESAKLSPAMLSALVKTIVSTEL